jgi:hypothetical protein
MTDFGKIRTLFDPFSGAYVKLYSAVEHLGMNQIIMLFKVRVIFKQYVPKKHKCFGIKIYKLCDITGYKYNIRIYLEKDRQNAMQMMPATHVTVRSLSR